MNVEVYIIMNKKNISIYPSILEQKQAEISYMQSISPTERLRQAIYIIRQVYKEQLLHNIPSKRITILKK